MSMPLFMLAVQNTVPHRFMGVSTSTMQFLRSVGGTMGVAIMFSLIQREYSKGLQAGVPEGVRSRPEFMAALKDPQFLLNKEAFARLSDAFSGFGDQGPLLLERTLVGVREALATAISEAFFISIFVVAAAVVIGVFMKELPLRRAHYLDEEDGAWPDERRSPAAARAAPLVGPMAGAANGALQRRPEEAVVRPPRRGLSLVSLVLVTAAALGLLALLARRNGRRP
jgi:hypothetical protein